jgi:hypothetical protein
LKQPRKLLTAILDAAAISYQCLVRSTAGYNFPAEAVHAIGMLDSRLEALNPAVISDEIFQHFLGGLNSLDLKSYWASGLTML